MWSKPEIALNELNKWPHLSDNIIIADKKETYFY